MKLILIAAFAALSAFAQPPQTAANPPKPEAKKEVAKVTPPAKAEAPAELPFTEVQNLKLQLAAARIALLNKKYDIPGYQKEVQPLAIEQQTIFMAACKQLGIPDSLIQTECIVQTGLDMDAKSLMGQDGKPVTPKVSWSRPAPPPVTVGAGTK